MDTLTCNEIQLSTPSIDQSLDDPLIDLTLQEQPMQFATASQLTSITPAESTFAAPPQRLRQLQPFDGYGYYQPASFPQPQHQFPQPQHQQRQQRPPPTSRFNMNIGYQPQIAADSQFEDSFRKHQVFACFVLWCCNCIFGLIAWSLVVTAEETKLTNMVEARRLAKVSLIVSICGIVVSVIIITVMISLLVTGTILLKF